MCLSVCMRIVCQGLCGAGVSVATRSVCCVVIVFAFVSREVVVRVTTMMQIVQRRVGRVFTGHFPRPRSVCLLYTALSHSPPHLRSLSHRKGRIR